MIKPLYCILIFTHSVVYEICDVTDQFCKEPYDYILHKRSVVVQYIREFYACNEKSDRWQQIHMQNLSYTCSRCWPDFLILDLLHLSQAKIQLLRIRHMLLKIKS